MAYAGRTFSTLSYRYAKKKGFAAHEEKCGECSKPRGFHMPDGILHDFVPTGQKAIDPRVSARRRR